MSYAREEVEDTVRRFVAAFKQAEATNKWAWLADEFYHQDCRYECPYAGAMPVVARNRDEIRATHYGRDMLVGWEGWTFPYLGWAVNGEQIITHWMNRGPGKRADGSYFETHGCSFITYGGQGKFIHQIDLFDLAHQMHLCDELEAAGLLSPQLKQDWVIPMKARLSGMLAQGVT